MSQINQLNTLDNPNDSDLLPIYSQQNGDARKVSVGNLRKAIESGNAQTEGFLTQYSFPAGSGFTTLVVSSKENIWLILRPTAPFNAGTIKLPPQSDLFDGQRFIVNTTEEILNLTIDGNGANLSGQPVTLAKDGSFELRYDSGSNIWYRVSGTSEDAQAVGYIPAGPGAVATTVQAKLRESVSVKDFGAIGDGHKHPLSERYATLAAAQAVYPFATALTQQIDQCAIQAALNHGKTYSRRVYMPKGKYWAEQLAYPGGVIWRGSGVGGYGSITSTYIYDATVIVQPSGVNDDLIVCDCRFEGSKYRIDFANVGDFVILKEGSTDTVGNGFSARQVGTDRATLANHALVNGISIFSNILCRGFPENGMYFRQGAAPMLLRDIEGIFLGGYTIRCDGENYARGIIMHNIQSDGAKGRAAIRVACATADADYSIDGVFTEYRADNPYGNTTGFYGAGPDGIEIGDFNTAGNNCVHVQNVYMNSIVSDEACRSGIFVNTSAREATPVVIFDNIVFRQNGLSTGTKATIYDNRSWDSFVTHTIPNTVKRGVYSVTDTGNTTPVAFDCGHVIAGDSRFHKPPVSTGGFQAVGLTPSLSLYETDAATDAKGWDIDASSGALRLRVFNDALSSSTTVLQVSRNGVAATGFDFAAPLRPGAVAKASLPSASATFENRMTMVTDPATNKGRLVYCDGSAWRYVSDDSAV